MSTASVVYENDGKKFTHSSQIKTLKLSTGVLRLCAMLTNTERFDMQKESQRPFSLSQPGALVQNLTDHWARVSQGPDAMYWYAWESRRARLVKVGDGLGWNWLGLTFLQWYTEWGINLILEFARRADPAQDDHQSIIRTWFGTMVDTLTLEGLPRPIDEPDHTEIDVRCELIAKTIDRVVSSLLPVMKKYHDDYEMRAFLIRLSTHRNYCPDQALA